jgi:hypothetical protein
MGPAGGRGSQAIAPPPRSLGGKLEKFKEINISNMNAKNYNFLQFILLSE